jgi:hypothetical protein
MVMVNSASTLTRKQELDGKLLDIYQQGWTDCAAGKESYLYTKMIGLRGLAYRMGWNNYWTEDEKLNLDGLTKPEILERIYVMAKKRLTEYRREQAEAEQAARVKEYLTKIYG